MLLTPMRYKGYVWPHNPRIYEINYERRLSVCKVPFGGYFIQNLGLTNRVLRGEGEFVGEGAYDEFKRLATVFYDEEPGLLVHPLWQNSVAYFAALSLKQKPLRDFVGYTFEFWECRDVESQEPRTLPREQAVYSAAGDTLWSIAARCGLPLSRLIELNPGIRNPNALTPGQSVTVGEAEA